VGGRKIGLERVNIYREQAVNECKVYCTESKVNGMTIQVDVKVCRWYGD
jgi:hypothetical protein